MINENEKGQISSQHEEIDRSLYNFLLRRIKIEKKDLGTDWFDNKKLEVTEYTFEGLPGYGFSNFISSKGDIENRIFDMLYDNNIIDVWPYSLDQRDPKRIKLVKTVRNFLNFVLSEQK